MLKFDFERPSYFEEVLLLGSEFLDLYCLNKIDIEDSTTLIYDALSLTTSFLHQHLNLKVFFYNTLLHRLMFCFQGKETKVKGPNTERKEALFSVQSTSTHSTSHCEKDVQDRQNRQLSCYTVDINGQMYSRRRFHMIPHLNDQ